jgi:hypothetical protein
METVLPDASDAVTVMTPEPPQLLPVDWSLLVLFFFGSGLG